MIAGQRKAAIAARSSSATTGVEPSRLHDAAAGKEGRRPAASQRAKAAPARIQYREGS